MWLRSVMSAEKRLIIVVLYSDDEHHPLWDQIKDCSRGRAAPAGVVATTFTNKAADALRARVRQLDSLCRRKKNDQNDCQFNDDHPLEIK
jgi:ATP-dependent exoDNAse (exonuclease V) beta subunit